MELFNFYQSEEVKPKQQAAIKQCYNNLRMKGIDCPVLDEDEEYGEEYDEEDPEDGCWGICWWEERESKLETIEYARNDEET